MTNASAHIDVGLESLVAGVVDEFRQKTAAVVWKQLRQRTIEPLVFLLGEESC